MLTNLMKDRVLLIQKTITQGALGQTVTYKPVQWKYCQVKLLSAQGRLQYQQLNSEATHEVQFRSDVTVSLGNYRIKWGSKTLEPTDPARLVDGNTIVPVKEI